MAPSPSSLIILTLREAHEIIRYFTTSLPGCTDWAFVASQVGNGRLSPQDMEYIANEFVPTIHYRPSIGMVVMERNQKGPASEYHRHKLAIRRLKQGLPLMIEQFKKITGKSSNGEQLKREESLVAMDTTTLNSPDLPSEDTSTLQTPIKEENDSEMASSTAPPSTSRVKLVVNVSNFESVAPRDYLEELRNRARTAIERYQNGDIPMHALRPVNENDAAAAGLTATGRVKRRYETKAIRLAKAAAASLTGQSTVSLGDIIDSPNLPPGAPTMVFSPHPMIVPVSAAPPTMVSPQPQTSFVLHSLFQQTAQQFARSRGSSASSCDDEFVE